MAALLVPDGSPRVWVLDLDGVLWLGSEPIPGSAGAVASLQSAGRRVLFLTNNSAPTVSDLVAKLAGFGVEAQAADIVTSAQAAAGMLEPGSTALVCASAGVVEALEERGIEPVRDGEADAVVVGFHEDFDYGRLTAAFKAVHGGARLIGTNDDPTYPTPHGPVPGGGALLAAVATAAGVVPEVAGKPYAPMAAALAARLGPDAGRSCVMVGDRPSTDGLMARRLGVPFALVLSGVTGEDPQSEPDGTTDAVRPDVIAADLAAVVAGPSLQETA